MTDTRPKSIQRLRLLNFKGFEDFTLTVPPGTACLVGPNSAGKSTLAEALAAVSAMLSYATRRKPDDFRTDGNLGVRCYGLSQAAFLPDSENLRFNFHEEAQVRVEATFAQGRQLHAVWPPSGDAQPPYFFLLRSDRSQPKTPTEVRDEFPRIGIVPRLTPIEHEEPLLDRKYVQATASTHLFSRHFRNHLAILYATDRSSYEQYLDFLRRYAPETSLGVPTVAMADTGQAVDIYYHEQDRFEKEICWAGDGVQIWLQLLFQMHMLSEYDCIVLDEPDVYLHADLQRRMVGLLEERTSQTIIITHSSEVLADANPQDIVWVDRVRRRGIRAPQGTELTKLSAVMGSAFNIRLARVLRSRAVMFVEGDDMKLLSILARKVDAAHVADEISVSVVPLGGATNWTRLEGFSWLARDWLGGSVDAYLLLDRDFHSDGYCQMVTERLAGAGVLVHFWARHELESYLLEPAVLARAAGLPEEQVRSRLLEIAERREQDFRDAMVAMLADEAGLGKSHVTQHLREANRVFAAIRKAPGDIIWRYPAKELMAGFNDHLQSVGQRAVTWRQLAREMRAEEVPDEMGRLLLRVERSAG